MGGISIWQLLIIALIVILLFGTKKLGTLGSDLGSALKGFKKAIGDDEEKKANNDADFDKPSISEKRDGNDDVKSQQKDKEQA